MEKLEKFCTIFYPRPGGSQKNLLLRSLVILDECHSANGKSPMAQLSWLLKLGIARCFLKVLRQELYNESCLCWGEGACVPHRKKNMLFILNFRVVIGEVGLIHSCAAV